MRWRIDTDSVKLKYSEKKLSTVKCHSLFYKCGRPEVTADKNVTCGVK